MDLNDLAAAIADAQRSGDDSPVVDLLRSAGWTYRRPTTRAEIEGRVVVAEDGCWYWTAGVNRHGYGHHRGRLAHIESYEAFVELVPVGLTLDHLCRVTFCVNPEHLEPVTREENSRRATLTHQPSPLANVHHGAKLWCIHGHSFDEKTTGVDSLGKRYCKTCRHDQLRTWRRAMGQVLTPVSTQFRIDVEQFERLRGDAAVSEVTMSSQEAAKHLGVTDVVFRGWVSRHGGVLTDGREHKRTGFPARWLASEIELLGQCRSSVPWSRSRKQ